VIYDCLTFFNELELLELRLHELAAVGDRHALVEATVTHHGRRYVAGLEVVRLVLSIHDRVGERFELVAV
jgi:hypothetical protein